MPDPAPASPTPGESPNAPTVTVTPQPTTTAGGDDNAGLLADLEAELAGKGAKPSPTSGASAAPADDDEPGEPPAEPGAEGDQPPAEDEEEPAVETPPEDEDLEDEEPPADPDDDPAIAAEADKDPALKARLDAVRRTEERQRARLASERQAFDQERQQFVAERGAAMQRLQQFDQLAARAKYDLPSVVRALGIEPADFEYHAQTLMAHSPKFASDEKYRGAAEKAMREREAADKAEAAMRKAAELEAKLEARDHQTAVERELDTYFARAMRKATDATPITAALIKNGPKAARAALTVTAHELTGKLGRMPTGVELLAAQERKEARALQLRGIKPAAKPAPAPIVAPSTGAAKPTPATKPNGQPAPAKPGKPVPAAAPAATTPAPADPHHIPTREEILAELASGAAN